MNIIEKLITKKPNFDGIYNDVFRQMVRTELFIADNVMDYYWETDKDWTTKNIPNVAPPFRDFFIGFNKFPRLRNDHPRAEWASYLSHLRGGVFFSAREIMEAQDPLYIERLGEMGKNRASLKKDGVKWILYATPIRLYQNILHANALRCVFSVREDGGMTDTMSLFFDGEAFGKEVDFFGWNLDAQEAQAHLMAANSPLLTTALITISMLHCRNVTTIDNRNPLGKVGKKPKLKRTGSTSNSGQIKFKTIRIEPIIKRILEDEGKAKEVGLIQALHTCRGHFKDYRHGSGLFGKHKHIYWWDEQERGDREAGVIVKDYEVITPNQKNAI